MNRQLTLVRDEFDKLKGGGLKKWEKLPDFVFLLLAEKSKLEELRAVIVEVLTRRFEHARKRTAHGTGG